MKKPSLNIQQLDEQQTIINSINKQGFCCTLTKGASMRPLFREHKDIVIIESLNRKPKVNDVLLYSKKGYKSLVLHRLLKIKKDGTLVIRGDNNYFTEYDIRENDIVGVLKEFYREGKYCNCKNKRYLIYSFYIRHSYALRYLWKKIVRPLLYKVYCLVFKKKRI